ncbi:hypothetical protein FALCPG4_012204 [Fusarium falciforme]
MPARNKAARDAARPELPDPSLDILKSMQWMSLEHPEYLAPESRVLHNNMEVLARLSTTILQGLRTAPIAEKSSRSRSVSSRRSAADGDEEDVEAELQEQDGSQEQMALRDQLKDYSETMEEFHRQWIVDGKYTPYVTRRAALDADADAFFTEVRMAGLPILNEGREDGGEESPLAQLLASLTHKSEAIMYIHYNKGYKAKNPGKPKKSSLKKAATGSSASRRVSTTTGGADITDRSSYSPGPTVFGARPGGPSRAASHRTPLPRDRSPLPESSTVSSFRERSPLMMRTSGPSTGGGGGGSRSGSGSVRGGSVIGSQRRQTHHRSRIIQDSEDEEDEEDPQVLSNDDEDDVPMIRGTCPAAALEQFASTHASSLSALTAFLQ